MKSIKTEHGKRLRIDGNLPAGFHGDQQGGAYLCPLDATNAAALRLSRARARLRAAMTEMALSRTQAEGRRSAGA